MVEMLRECTGSSNPHQIVIGPRGSGKTSLLLRVAAEIRQDPELSLGFFPVVFAEESYEVDTAGEFWLEALSKLADQTTRQENAPDLRRTFEDLRTIQDDQTLGDRCLGTLLDYSDREGKRFVLMVENLNMMFRDMSDRDAGWRLRKILQTEPAHHPARERHQPLRRDRPPGPRPLRPVQGTHATPSRHRRMRGAVGSSGRQASPAPRRSAHWRFSPAAARVWSPSWPGSARLAPFASS